MADYAKLAKDYRNRADRLEHCADHVGPLPQVPAVLYELDDDGEASALANYDNEFIADAIKALREHASLLQQLADSECYADAMARDANKLLCAHDPDAFEAADEGWLDGMSYADDMRDMY
jgi:hypothetical protein